MAPSRERVHGRIRVEFHSRLAAQWNPSREEFDIHPAANWSTSLRSRLPTDAVDLAYAHAPRVVTTSGSMLRLLQLGAAGCDRCWLPWPELDSQGCREHDGDERVERAEQPCVPNRMSRRVTSEVSRQGFVRIGPPLNQRSIKWTHGEVVSQLLEWDLSEVATGVFHRERPRSRGGECLNDAVDDVRRVRLGRPNEHVTQGSNRGTALQSPLVLARSKSKFAVVEYVV